ncbi:hypothetical protein Egran_06734 [Elaphomyces granulatus]|uniref:DUF676 domain-containing protein n=1 Tax=Elaphomyces granulatus TaxID=519963 RepID=A0A232LNC3_9EURO|nr:hypothetical protein Egran_06734 [Elaphomyces granulatus]
MYTTKMARRSTTFRVSGLPAEQPNHTLEADLLSLIEKNLLDEEKPKIHDDDTKLTIDIVPSCYDPVKESVALVDFRNWVPNFLSAMMENQPEDPGWQAQMGSKDLNFDCHFFGFTQLYKPKEPVTADIIAIPGLDGHAYGSWKGRGNLSRMWLRHFLSKDLPHCRTMIYGYDSKISLHAFNTTMDYARGLIEEIKKIRNSSERPLFFITHGYGGILLAHCLVKAVQIREDSDPMASLYKATYGILQFATPNKGMVIDDMKQITEGEENHPRNDLLRDLKLNSSPLIQQLDAFKNLIKDRKVVSFYETRETRRLELDSNTQHWRRTGDYFTPVDTNTSLLQLPDNIEEKIPAATDHSGIVKFDGQYNATYRSALTKLRQFEQDAPSAISARFHLQSTTSFSESRSTTPVPLVAGELNPGDGWSFYRSMESNGSQDRIEVMDESSIKERLSE